MTNLLISGLAALLLLMTGPGFPHDPGALAADTLPDQRPQSHEPISGFPRQVVPRKLSLGAGHGDTLSFGYSKRIEGVPFALPNEVWTWDHGGADVFEGWTAVDMTANHRSWFQHVTNEDWAARRNEGPAPVLAGRGSLWLGAFQDQADSLCWRGGTGYGNNWCQALASPPLNYDGSGSVRLRFKYFSDTEAQTDRVIVVLRTSGREDLVLNDAGFGGRLGIPPAGPWGLFNREITKDDFGGYMPREFRILFQFDSDDGNSDEDGFHPTPCGPFGLDDVTLSGGIPGKEIVFRFEEGFEGWKPLYRSGLGAHFSVSTLKRYRIEDAGACGLSGNIATFHDPEDQHPEGQYVAAFSPAVDLTENRGYGNIFADWDIYGVMPASNGVFYRAGWSYWPFVCPTTRALTWSPRVGDPTWQYTGGEPKCLHRRIHAASSGVPPEAQRIRFVFEVAGSCSGFGIDDEICTGLTNFTPAIDNVQILMTREPMGELAFEQLSFENGDSLPVRNSDIGRLRFEYPPEEPGHLNVALRRPERPERQIWAVRNLALTGRETTSKRQEILARFPLSDLGVAPGERVERLAFAWTLTPSPLLDEDFGAWLENAAWHPAVQPDLVVMDAMGAGSASAPSVPLAGLSFPWFQPYLPPAVSLAAISTGDLTPNLDLNTGDRSWDRAGSFPAATVNAVQALLARAEPAALTQDLRDAYRDIEYLLGRSPSGEVEEGRMIQALLDYIEAYDLPLRVRYRSPFLGRTTPSASGLSQAERRSNEDGEWPDLAHVVEDAANGDVVALVVGQWVQDGQTLRRHHGTASVLTGAHSVAGVTKLTCLYDDSERDGSGPVQEQSEVHVLDGGLLHLPGLDRRIRLSPGGDPLPSKAILESAISLSYEGRKKPSADQHVFADHGQWFIRTVPPRHRLAVRFPDRSDRGFKASVYQLERGEYPPRLVKVRVWNWNSDAVRRVVNNTDRCMTVALRNEDWQDDGEEYGKFTIRLAVESAGLDEASSAANEEACGGFFVGAMDGKSDEFDPLTGERARFADGLGDPLAGVPRVLGSGGIGSLTVSGPVAQWNPYWSRLFLHLGVASVRTAGVLRIECPQAGFSDSLVVDRNGHYHLDLGTVAQSPEVELTLTPGAGLAFELDGVGLAAQTRPGLK